MATCILARGGGNGVGSDDCTATSAQVLKGYFAITQDSDDEIKEGTIPRITSKATTAYTTSNETTTINLNQFLEKALKIYIPSAAVIRSGYSAYAYIDGDQSNKIVTVEGELGDYNLDGDF